jgi:hypothetical protein
MSKAATFNAAKYRSNRGRRLQTTSMTRSRPMTPLLSERLVISRAPTEWGPLPKRRSRRSIQIAPRRHGSNVRHSIEGADRTRRAVVGKAGCKLRL